MDRHAEICFVIADGGHARFVRTAADNALHTIEALDSATLHDKSHDLGTDRPGRTFESASSTRHAMTPRHDPHELEKDRFARLVGARINAEVCDELVLVAPAHVLALLDAALDVAARGKVMGTLAKDLAGVPDHELWPHLKEWARPVHRV